MKIVEPQDNISSSEDNARAWVSGFSDALPIKTQDALVLANGLVEKSLAEKNLDVDPVIAHARGVVEVLISLRMRNDAILAAFLCSAPENLIPVEKIQTLFNPVVSELYEGVQKLRIVDEYQSLSSNLHDEKSHLEGLRKLLLGMAQDIRVVLIKLAERVQLMREIKTMPEEIRRRVARETMDIFTPLANRLGIWQIKWELEDLSFRFLEPEAYQKIARLLDERRTDREEYINNVVKDLQGELNKAGINADVAGRPKHIYSIWRKMNKKDIDFHNLFDVRAVRVLVNDIASCYAVLGIVHSRWQPIRSEFDDYIASPKQNMYQSLHTAVMGPAGKTLEVQIRTHDMHQHSEHGVAAHWGYKEGGRQDDAYREKIAWLRQILDWKEEERNTADFIDRFKSEIFQDRVYVLTPQGKVVDLPVGATPLDFAYHIHTDIGHRYRGAKINGKIVPIHYELKNGEQVEILTNNQGSPSRDWLNPHLGYLKSSRARAKVRGWFRLQDYENNVVDGRQVIERELHRLGLADVNMEQLADRYNLKTADDLFAAVGCGDITSTQIAGGLNEQFLPGKERRTNLQSRHRTGDQADGKSEISIMGVGELATNFARCCKPVPYDRIVGYITRGRGITIHRDDCRNLKRLQTNESERLIDVEWSEGTSNTYTVDIHIKAFDRQGLLRDITEILSNDKLNVMAVNTMSDRKTHMANMTLTLEVMDAEQLSRAISKIDQLPNIMEVWRKTS
ncbi:GTP diphosphokinase [Kaarinaea lacus]